MLLAEIVETSRRLGETSKRLEKIGLLAQLLKQLSPEEIELGVLYLSGAIRQARLGVGYAALRGAAGAAAAEPSLELLDVDRTLAAVAEMQGTGSAGRRREMLSGMLARATQAEQEFLVRLIGGELRQGALEGIMMEAIAKASGVSAAHIRRAVMMSGNMATVARSVMEKGEPGLSQYDIQLFRPCSRCSPIPRRMSRAHWRI
jgi:DNA ligase N terminus.